jgi:hypothetical protein
MKKLLFISLFLLIFSSTGYPGKRSTHEYTYRPHRSNYAEGVQRNRYGRIARDPAVKRQFMRQAGYPKGRPGHVVDHIIPLKRGGADHPDNMQWQTQEEARAKDKVE